MVDVLSSHQYVIKIGLNGWGSTPWHSTSSMSLSGKLSSPFPLASQVETNSSIVNVWSQAVVDPWVALVARMARGSLCRHWRKDIWHMVSNDCQQKTASDLNLVSDQEGASFISSPPSFFFPLDCLGNSPPARASCLRLASTNSPGSHKGEGGIFHLIGQD